MHTLKWLMPGMQVKRWLVATGSGVTLAALGVTYGLRELYDNAVAPAHVQPVVIFVTLQWVPQWLRALVFIAAGIALLGWGILGLNRSLLTAVHPEATRDLVDRVDQRRRSRAQPKIVVLGGGTGLSTLLRGLKAHTQQLTAIVTVADDGGSSGRLRRSLGVHPPGDFRQCIAALADTEPLVQRLFEYRFGDGSELGGHAFGNLFIVAMTGITGSFESALRASSRVLAVRGRIVPSTLAHVTLSAELEDDRVMAGESNVPHGNAAIRRVFLDPASPPAFPEAVAAILDADLVVLGPGSLYTSVLPNLLVPDIAAAIETTRAPVLYVANVATQPGETDGYTLRAHVEAIRRHLGREVIDAVLANDRLIALPPDIGVTAVLPDLDGAGHPRLVTAAVIDAARPTRHDPEALAEAVVRFLNERGRQPASPPRAAA